MHSSLPRALAETYHEQAKLPTSRMQVHQCNKFINKELKICTDTYTNKQNTYIHTNIHTYIHI